LGFAIILKFRQSALHHLPGERIVIMIGLPG